MTMMKENKPNSAMVERRRQYRWNAPVKARVTHPKHGEVVVPCRSKLSAILCAAELWGVHYQRILHAEVMAINEKNPE